MTLILLTIGAGVLLLIWLGLSAPKLPEGQHKGRLIITRYINSKELTGEVDE